MDKKESFFKYFLDYSIIILLSFACAVFSFLYFNGLTEGFIYDNIYILKVVSATLFSLLCVCAVIFGTLKFDFIYRLIIIVLVLALFCFILLYVLNITGLADKIDSIEDLRALIAQAGSLAVLLFLMIQILQVVVLPIPGFIAVGAGVAFFGVFWGAFLSLIGIYIGSVMAFFIGRGFGYKAVAWLVGKDNLEKGLNLCKGKDKIILSFMFLFPLFPDDLLCFVAGLSSMSVLFYLIMCAVTRIISVFVCAYSISGTIVPYNTWWGILIYVAFGIITVLLSVLVYKKGKDIEKFFSEKIFKQNAKKRKKQTKKIDI